MASLLKRHLELVDGEGCCSVPMWSNGCPAGFCEEPAYGYQVPNQTVYGKWVSGKFYSGYCSGLACPAHGGPNQRIDDAK